MFRLSNKKALGQGLKCKVQLLVPGEEIEINYNNNSSGQDILNDVVAQLDILDKDYYGLKLYDQMQWLDLTKSVLKQTKGLSEVIFVLRFKYYPAEPALLANESTRYYLYLQLRADLLEGRLKADSQDTESYLIACVLQSELGDATTTTSTSSPASKRRPQQQQQQEHREENYVSEFKFVPNQSEDLEWASIRLHQSEDFLGLKPADAELNFLKKACQLDTYGIDPYPVKESDSHDHFLIGVNYRGITTFQDSKRTNLLGWDIIERISLEKKLVIIYCRRMEKKGEKVSKTSSLFAFKCPSQDHAHNFWKVATEHRYFFTLETSPPSPIVTNTGGLFRKSHKLKYAGRVEKDLLRDHVDEVRSTGVKRSRSLMIKTSNDGPLWHGFPQANNTNINNNNNNGNGKLQGSMNNIYASDSINKTLPSNMNYFREEDEEHLAGGGAGGGGTGNSDDPRKTSMGSVSRDSPKVTNFTRRSVLTSKNDVASGQAIRKGSQIYMDTEQQGSDFIRASVFLFVTLIAVLIIILLISDTDRPNSVSLLVKKMNLENVSLALRNNYYLPLKSAVRQSFASLFSILDLKLL